MRGRGTDKGDLGPFFGPIGAGDLKGVQVFGRL